jgi:hypothetical protein
MPLGDEHPSAGGKRVAGPARPGEGVTDVRQERLRLRISETQPHDRAGAHLRRRIRIVEEHPLEVPLRDGPRLRERPHHGAAAHRRELDGERIAATLALGSRGAPDTLGDAEPIGSVRPEATRVVEVRALDAQAHGAHRARLLPLDHRRQQPSREDRPIVRVEDARARRGTALRERLLGRRVDLAGTLVERDEGRRRRDGWRGIFALGLSRRRHPHAHVGLVVGEVAEDRAARAAPRPP